MAPCRQKDYSTSSAKTRFRRSQRVVKTIVRHQWTNSTSTCSTSEALYFLSNRYIHNRSDYYNYISRQNRISLTAFSFSFNRFRDLECLIHFRFRKIDVIRLVQLMGWPAEKLRAARNRYAVSPLLCCCILLRRLATPARWTDVQLCFGKDAPQLSEMFWESIEHLLAPRQNLITSLITASFVRDRVAMYAQAVHAKGSAMENCAGFINWTELAVARPKGHLAQSVVYNGHKRKHAFKYQAINTPDGLIQHVHGPIEGSRHD